MLRRSALVHFSHLGRGGFAKIYRQAALPCGERLYSCAYGIFSGACFYI